MDAMQTDSMSITTNSSFWSIKGITKDGRQQRHAISNTSHRAKKQAHMNWAKLARQEKKRQQRESETMR